MAITKQSRRNRIKKRVRKVVSGTAESPRLTVFRSNKGIYAQLIDDETGVTKCQMSTLPEKSTLNVESAKKIGLEIAKKGLKLNIKKVWFDRGRFLYHGRVKALADGAREGGLEF